MSNAKRIFFVAETTDFTGKLLKTTSTRGLVKGLIRLGHDVQVFSYNNAFGQIGFIKLKWQILYKSRVDELLAKQIKNYAPDIVLVGFARYIDAQTVKLIREGDPGAVFIGRDTDLWPEFHENRIEAARELDLITATYSGKGLDTYSNTGTRCAFLPNMCDPDIEYRYEVLDKWKSDILFTGKASHVHYPTEDIRPQIVDKLSRMKNCVVYGCCGKPSINGMNYLYAISGTKIGLSINAANDISLYHSNRLIQYLSCGTFALVKRVPDTDLLFKDGTHLRYFDTAEEFFELADWYLKHGEEREKIARAGMEHAHKEFNCTKIAGYLMDLIETGKYDAPWAEIL